MTEAIPFSKRIEFEKNDWVITYRAKDAAGQDFFSYIFCDLAGYMKMQNDWKNKISATGSAYGKVIYTDSLANPDAKAKAFLQFWLAKNS